MLEDRRGRWCVGTRLGLVAAAAPDGRPLISRSWNGFVRIQRLVLLNSRRVVDSQAILVGEDIVHDHRLIVDGGLGWGDVGLRNRKQARLAGSNGRSGFLGSSIGQRLGVPGRGAREGEMNGFRKEAVTQRSCQCLFILVRLF